MAVLYWPADWEAWRGRQEEERDLASPLQPGSDLPENYFKRGHRDHFDIGADSDKEHLYNIL
jgi:hypothetical protein